MRWKYCFNVDPDEDRARKEIEKRITSFWEGFVRDCEQIGSRIHGYQARENVDWLVNWMKSHLQAIHPELMWEFGPAVDKDGMFLVISPEGRRNLRPLTEKILSYAPNLSTWEFYGYRPPVRDFKNALMKIAGRTASNFMDVYFKGKIGETNKIDLTFYSDSYPKSKDYNENLGAIWTAIETLCGEEFLDKSLGIIDFKKVKKKELEKLEHISSLKESAEKLIKIARETLPSSPYYLLSDDLKYSVLEFKPEKMETYPKRTDIFLLNTLGIFTNMFRDGEKEFDSIRFSNFGEIFAYLKIEGTGLTTQEKFDKRNELSDIIDKALRSQELGCTIGGALGYRYYYVDLALFKPEIGIKNIRDTLTEKDIVKEAWLLFFDSDLEDEWVGYYDDCPPPPKD